MHKDGTNILLTPHGYISKISGLPFKRHLDMADLGPRGWRRKAGSLLSTPRAPPVIFLEQIYKVTKADADHLLRQHFKARNAHVCQADAIDVRANGLKKHFHRIQTKGNPPIQWLNRNVNVQGRMIRAPKGRARIRLQECIALAEGTEATFGEARIAVQAVKAQDVDVTVISGALPTSGAFRTHQIITDVDELGEEFQSFWGQIWNRDRADTTWEDQKWDQARTLVAECGEAWPQIQVEWNDLDMWRAVLRQLPSGRARGVDGWSYEELRQLPDGAIEHLGQLMQRIEADGSFPQPAMQARTVLLPKQAQTEGMSGTRPITILGCHTGGLRSSILRQ